MSKKTRNKKPRKGLTPDEVLSQAKENRKKTLRESIKAIYDSVDLNTTGCEITVCHCACCRVAMPQMNYCEFVQLVTDLWRDSDDNRKIEIICKSIEYYFKNDYEKWGMDSLIKPCQFVSKEGRCTVYANRPASCRVYGLWPQDVYEKRVSQFEEVYSKYGLKREDLPLAKQCKMIKRKDGSTELTKEECDSIYGSLDNLDKSIGNFSNLQIKNRENYRAFHDWLLLKIFGEDWLVKLTVFSLGATREQMEDQVEQIRLALNSDFLKGINGVF